MFRAFPPLVKGGQGDLLQWPKLKPSPLFITESRVKRRAEISKLKAKEMKITNFIILLILICHPAASAQDLMILTETNSDSSYYDKAKGALAGYSVEIVHEIMRRSGIDDQIHILPWKRAYQMLRTKDNIALFATTRTKQREKLFKWVGPLHEINWALFAKKGTNIQIKSLEDAKKVGSIGCYLDDAKHQFLIANGFTNLEPIAGHNVVQRNFEKLYLGRIDLLISSNAGIASIAGNVEYKQGDFVSLYTIKTQYLYIAFSKNIDDRIVESWQNALMEMKNDGTYEKILQSYPTGKTTITFDSPEPAQ